MRVKGLGVVCGVEFVARMAVALVGGQAPFTSISPGTGVGHEIQLLPVIGKLDQNTRPSTVKFVAAEGHRIAALLLALGLFLAVFIPIPNLQLLVGSSSLLRDGFLRRSARSDLPRCRLGLAATI